MAEPSPEILPRLNGRRVVIVGAGISGLSAGVMLAERGFEPLILEQKPSPGGRAYSFRETGGGEVIDNGQHLLIAGYPATFRFLERIGTAHLVSIQDNPRLVFHHPERGFCRFAIPPWRPPFHLIAAAAGTNLLCPADRRRLLRAGRMLHRELKQSESSDTVSEWLDRAGQSPEARRSFWDPLVVSIMNERPERATAAPFLRSLRDAFVGSWRNARIAVPRAGLSQVFADPACEFIRHHGGTVLCNRDVAAILADESTVSGVILRDGTEIRADAVILAVPPHRLPKLLPDIAPLQQLRTSCESFAYSPIVSTHLWYPEEVMPHEFAGLIGRRTQWVFNRRRITGTSREGGHLSAVVSAAYDVVDLPNDDIIRFTVDELADIYGPQAGRPLRATVIREKRATISLTTSAETERPPQKTVLRNLFLAGDWTATGYPATIEGAALSGERAAGLVSGLVET